MSSARLGDSFARLHGPPPGPSRSPSFTSASDAERQAEDESADDSDYLDPDIVADDEINGEEGDAVQSPAIALATPKPQIAPWPFQHEGQSSPVLTHVQSPSLDATMINLGPPPIIPASSLPHEILLHILRMLPTSSLAPALLVCKAWCQCGVELLWHKPAFASMPALERAIQILADPDQTFPYAHFIRRLNFSALRGDLRDEWLAKLTPCARLERLTLAGCTSLTPQAIINLLEGCPRLVALDLSDVKTVTDAVVETVARNCPRLQGLNLSGCELVTDRAIEAIARGCPGLRRIKLRNVALLTSTPVILLSISCPLLLEVDLVGCVLIKSIALQQLLRSSHHLRELSVSACAEIGDDGFPPPHAPAAPTLWGRQPAEDAASQEQLTCADGSLIPSPRSLGSLPPLRTFDHLRYLDLTSVHHLTDAAISGIVRHMPRIRNLILAKCHRLTDEAIVAVATLGKHLHYLHLGHLALITDAAVTVLARSCTRLRYIDLANCNLLTDLSVFELATNLPRLKRIGLVRVFQVTDEAIHALFVRTSLERIHLSYCDHLTVGAIHQMLQRLPRLTHLSLTGVRSFRRKDLQKFCRPPPPEFNSHQRDTFCVYSGKGVHELKRYLRSLGDSLQPNAVEESAHGTQLWHPTLAQRTRPPHLAPQTATIPLPPAGPIHNGHQRGHNGQVQIPIQSIQPPGLTPHGSQPTTPRAANGGPYSVGPIPPFGVGSRGGQQQPNFPPQQQPVHRRTGNGEDISRPTNSTVPFPRHAGPSSATLAWRDRVDQEAQPTPGPSLWGAAPAPAQNAQAGGGWTPWGQPRSVAQETLSSIADAAGIDPNAPTRRARGATLTRGNYQRAEVEDDHLSGDDSENVMQD